MGHFTGRRDWFLAEEIFTDLVAIAYVVDVSQVDGEVGLCLVDGRGD